MKQTIYTRLLLALLCLAAATAPLITYSENAGAISGTDFKADNIIGNASFYDKNSMNPAEIQAFLNAKVPNCTAGYTCLKDYRQDTPQRQDSQGLCATYPAGNKVAAQIIYDVSQVCGINPQTLIVLLQKEQALVTDPDPSDIQYRSATGYGCPDSAACSSEYYGFFNQVYRAAWQYKYYAAHPEYYSYRAGRTNSILWNPNTACGRSDIYIENQATAGLYIYTPYRPNQAALDNLYGLGDGCSSYGNRNFWRIFSDWFGINNKPLIRTVSSGTLYYVAGQYKHQIPSMDIAHEFGFSNNDVGFVSQTSLDSISSATTPLNFIIKSTSDSDEDGGDIYLITEGRRLRITSMDQLTRFGFSADDITYLPYYAIVRMAHSGNLSDFVHGPNGFVYKVDNIQKSGIFQPSVYHSLNPGGSASKLSPFALDRLATTTPIISGYIGLKGADGRVWIASSSGWSYIPSMIVADCTGVSQAGITSFSPQMAVVGTQLESASCVVSDGGSNQYILDKTRKIPLQSAWGLTSKTVPLPALLTNKPTSSAQDLSAFRNPVDGALYTLQDGKKRYITNMDILAEIGQTAQDIISMNSGMLSQIPDGHSRLASGSIVQNTSTGQLYVVNNDQKLYITNMNVFNQFGFSTSSISRFSASTLGNYSTMGNLSTLFRSGSSEVFVDGSNKYFIPDELNAHYGVLAETPTYNLTVAKRATRSLTATRYMKSVTSSQLYYLENGVRRPIHSWNTFTQLGGTTESIMTLTNSGIETFPIGTQMQ